MNYHFTVNGAIKEIKKHLKQENFNEASKICDALLQFDPTNKFAKKSKKKISNFSIENSQIVNKKYSLSYLAEQFSQGNFIDVIDKCQLLINSGQISSDLYNYYGSALKENGLFEKALSAFDKSIEIDKKNFIPHFNKGLIFYKVKNFESAEKSLLASLSIKPDFFMTNFLLGVVFQESIEGISPEFHPVLLGRSIKYFEIALKLNPKFINIYSNYGNVLIYLKKFDQAKNIFLKGIEVDNKNSNLHYNLGNLFEKLQEFDKAISYFKKAVEFNPNMYQAHNNLSTLLIKHKKNYKLALDHINFAISLHSDADYISNKASLLEEMGEIDSAFKTIQKSINQNSQNSKAYYNQGKIFDRIGNIKEALKSYEQSIDLDPMFVDARWNKGIDHLLLGEFEHGWKYYETRRQRPSWIKRVFNGKELSNLKQLQGKSILLYSEQGLGDTIQFSRFATHLEGIASDIILEVQKPLKKLLSEIPNVKIVTKDEQIKTDYHFPLMSLPKLLNINFHNISKPTNLKLNNEKIIKWGNKLNKGKFNIGVAWLGSRTHEDDKDIVKYRRSFSSSYFKCLEDLDKVNLFSLQKHSDLYDQELKEIPKNINIFKDFDNNEDAFIDTISLIKNLDLVISCDTSIAHIAGSLNCPIWVPLKFIPDWRWMLNSNNTPYYPTMSLYRQKHWGNWNEVFERIKKDISHKINKDEGF